MTLFEMLQDKLPKEKEEVECQDHSCDCPKNEYNNGINAVFSVLKLARVDEGKVMEAILVASAKRYGMKLETARLVRDTENAKANASALSQSNIITVGDGE